MALQPTSSLQVAVIPATKRSAQNNPQLKSQASLRVAAYCRVSTGDESQQSSYTNQKAFYRDLICSHPGWQFADIYADDALSGTSRTRRVEFNRMMEDAKNGKLDYIITKSISRFARNTVDTLDCVRELRQLTPPVGIYFEKENIDTLNATGELILTILSALAQDESRSISDNIRWTFQKNFQAGIPQINLKRMLGYDKAADGTWVINPAQAAIVRRIFTCFLAGKSANKIAAELNDAELRTVNGKQWRADAVLRILRNEKYAGDLEMQKTITKDFLTHRSTINRGEAPRYYVKDHHVPIVDRLTWDRVQAMLHEPSDAPKPQNMPKRKKLGSSAFHNLVCGVPSGDGEPCDGVFLRLTYSRAAAGYRDERSLSAAEQASRYTERYSYAQPVWRCEKKRGGRGGAATFPCPECPFVENGCPSPLLHEIALEQSFMELLYMLKRDYLAQGSRSHIHRLFAAAHARTPANTPYLMAPAPRLDTLAMQIQEIDSSLQMCRALKDASPSEDLLRLEESIRLLNRQREELVQEKTSLEETQSFASAAERQFAFFLRCLTELPDVNPAGMPLLVNGLDRKGSLLRDFCGHTITGARSSLKTAPEQLTPQEIASAPELLPFSRSIYAAFILEGIVKGDVIEYITNFGVTLVCHGNRRTLNSFLGFKRCNEDGSIDFLDQLWKVNGRKVQYTRKEKGEETRKQKGKKTGKQKEQRKRLKLS